jgi:hypothetical protein
LEMSSRVHLFRLQRNVGGAVVERPRRVANQSVDRTARREFPPASLGWLPLTPRHSCLPWQCKSYGRMDLVRAAHQSRAGHLGGACIIAATAPYCGPFFHRRVQLIHVRERRAAALRVALSHASKLSSLAKTAAADSRRRCYVIRPLLDWVCDRDRWPDLCRTLATRSRTLDCGGRDHTYWSRDSERCKGDTSEGSCEIEQAEKTRQLQSGVRNL